MHPALLRRDGLPRGGLVALYDFARTNFVNWSEEFTQSTWGKSNVTVTATGTTFRGMPLFAVNDASTSARGDLGIIFSPVTVGQRVGGSFILQAGTSSYVALRLTINVGNGGNPTIGVDLNTGVVTAFGTGASGTAVPLGDGFWRVSILATVREAMTGPRLLLMPAAGDATLLGQGATASAPPTGQVLATAVMVWFGDALAYERTTDGQTLVDRSGNAYHATLGSTAAADSNDPAWTTEGLRFDGVDDFAAHGRTLTGPRTFIQVLAPEPTTNSYPDWGQIGHTMFFGNATATALSANNRRADGTNAGLGLGNNLTPGQPVFVAASVQQGLQAGYLNGVRTFTVSVTNLQEVDNATWYGSNFGKRPAGSEPNKGRQFYAAIYSRALSDAEIARAYRVIKRQLAGRGVALP